VHTAINLSDSIKWWKFLEWLSSYWLFKKGSVPWNRFAVRWRDTVSNNMPKTKLELWVKWGDVAESRPTDRNELMSEIWT
jgi:hypothetical protein